MQANSPSIIVPLDGSATSEKAIPLASAIARRTGSPIALVHVHDDGVLVANAPMMDGGWEDERAAEMGAVMRAMADRLARETGLRVSTVMLRGRVAPSLVQHAIDQNAHLIVMTTHGRTGFSHAWFGSVAEQVVHSTVTPVLIVRSGDHARTNVTEPLFRRVLVPIDRELSGADAMKHALILGTPHLTTYTLLTVVSAVPVVAPPFSTLDATSHGPNGEIPGADARALLERIAEPARAAGAITDVRVMTHERAAPAILESAESEVDLIVMSMRPRRAVSRALLGSVVDKVMRGAVVPLLLFRASPVDEAVPANASRRPLLSAPSDE